jgi:hypothetical protein
VDSKRVVGGGERATISTASSSDSEFTGSERHWLWWLDEEPMPSNYRTVNLSPTGVLLSTALSGYQLAIFLMRGWHLTSIATIDGERKQTAFYVDQHNQVIPHSACKGQTPGDALRRESGAVENRK